MHRIMHRTQDKVPKADVEWDRQREIQNTRSKPKSSPTEQKWQRENPKPESNEYRRGSEITSTHILTRSIDKTVASNVS